MFAVQGAERGGYCATTGQSQDNRIWSHSTKQTFFTSSSGIRNLGFSVASGVWDICPPFTTSRLGIMVHEVAHQWGIPDVLKGDGKVSTVMGQ
jgi:hypothetical protein